MKKLFFILFLILSITPLEAQWCGRPCLRDRYYNPGWVDDECRYYGFIDINDYPYALPVNIYFNPRPCHIPRGYYTIRFVEEPYVCPRCPRCNASHR